MLYILLIIIAVGVLLASEEGKELLGTLQKFIFWGALLYVGFWAVIIIIGLLSQQSIQNAITGEQGSFVISFLLCALIYKLYRGYKKGKQDKTTFIVWSVIFGIIAVALIFPYFW